MKCKICGEIYQVFDIVCSKSGRLWVKIPCILNRGLFMQQFSYVPDENYMYYVPLSNVTEFMYETMSIEDNKEQQQINIADDPLNEFCKSALKTSATIKTPIDWEQRKYELAAYIFDGIIDFDKDLEKQSELAINAAEIFINTYKKKQNE